MLTINIKPEPYLTLPVILEKRVPICAQRGWAQSWLLSPQAMTHAWPSLPFPSEHPDPSKGTHKWGIQKHGRIVRKLKHFTDYKQLEIFFQIKVNHFFHKSAFLVNTHCYSTFPYQNSRLEWKLIQCFLNSLLLPNLLLNLGMSLFKVSVRLLFFFHILFSINLIYLANSSYPGWAIYLVLRYKWFMFPSHYRK